jgi:protein disulfide-isomerase-like protein
MLKYALLSSLIIALFSVWANDVDAAFKDENIVKLNPDNFEAEINGETPILVKFYAPWCGHCKTMAPAYAEAAKILKEQKIPVKLGSLVCSEYGEFCTKLGIQGYPTLWQYSKGVHTPYEGARTAVAIVNSQKKYSIIFNFSFLGDYYRQTRKSILANFPPSASQRMLFWLEILPKEARRKPPFPKLPPISARISPLVNWRVPELSCSKSMMKDMSHLRGI